ncbi:helix-turn-helix domain-containing protein [Mycolicibacterium sp. lyk4-40-TYG-92]|uniref:winged helix-turn-helix transcriptional regulator n=1 Tax=Mycolicibacterium sp. lyk4-40-TYG-92 TaxID=3040295 RepID=UPI00254ABB83|nr:helix-turn-helix domain-containing protein [Mycolicibacterium sp. lyk4-40-TYG-92]
MSDTAEPTDNGRDGHWDREAWNLEPDSIALALDALSPRTTGAIIREAFYGTRRFDDFQRHCGVSPSVLATRLRACVADGLLQKVPYRTPGTRERDEYRLTDKGRSLAPILLALNDWADRWLLEPDAATVSLRHRDCGQRIHATVTCEAGHQVTAVADMVAAAGPGARPAHKH